MNDRDFAKLIWRACQAFDDDTLDRLLKRATSNAARSAGIASGAALREAVIVEIQRILIVH